MRPCREESVDFDNTENLYIEGDNLDVMKLLREDYLGKVKMIYIDPPYNTGKDFLYEDNFAQNAQEYTEQSGQTDDYGNRLVNNTESNGRFHSDWLNMIYPRLKVARDFLSDDGVIFISIDDNEVENLKKVCDEIFGVSNFISEFPRVTKRGGKSTDTYAKNHDYVICYTKNCNDTTIKGIAHIDPGFSHKDEYFEKRGAYKLNQTLDYNTLQYNTSMDFPIEINGKTFVPGGDISSYNKRHDGIHAKHDWVWRWSQKKFEFGYQNGWIVISKTGRIYTKTYLNASIEKDPSGNYYIKYEDRTRALSTLDFVDNVYSNDNSNKEFTSLMGSTLFDYVKPTSLILKLLETTTNTTSVIMDFFSGSATTAHAVMKKNAEDNGKRKFILVQIPEITRDGSDAKNEGYKNICEIGKERIRRAGKKLLEELKEKQIGERTSNYQVHKIDVGFRVLKLDSSNMKDVYYKPSDVTNDLFARTEDNIKADRTDEDLLFQVMLELAVPLSAKIRSEEISCRKVMVVDDDYLIACFDKDITDEVVTDIAKRKPQYFVMRDSSAMDDSVITNFETIFQTYSKDTTRKIL